LGAGRATGFGVGAGALARGAARLPEAALAPVLAFVLAPPPVAAGARFVAGTGGTDSRALVAGDAPARGAALARAASPARGVSTARDASRTADGCVRCGSRAGAVDAGEAAEAACARFNRSARRSASHLAHKMRVEVTSVASGFGVNVALHF